MLQTRRQGAPTSDRAMHTSTDGSDKTADALGRLASVVQDVLDTLSRALERFTDTKASHAAAALAYYAFFSLFPLLLGLVVGVGAILSAGEAKTKVLAWIQGALPISTQLVESTVEQALEVRGAIGAIGAVGLLWSASGVFNTLAYSVNLAWHQSSERGFLGRRLVALAMVLALLALLLLSLTSSAIVRFLPALQTRFDVPMLSLPASFFDSMLWVLGSIVVPWVFSLLLFLALYRWVPTARVSWGAALGGAIIAATGWEVAGFGFASYVRSGLARYELIYGSLGTVVVLLLWIYISALITLFGAHVSSALGQPEAAETGDARSAPRAFVVLNPVAGSSEPDEVRAALSDHLARRGWAIAVHETESDEDLTRIVRRASEDGYDRFIAAGGDGTVAAVAGGLAAAGSEVPVAVIPTGTGNTIARELGVPLQLDSACSLAVGEHEVRQVDALMVGDRRFFLNVSIGVSAEAIRDTGRRSKQRVGFLAYVITGLQKLLGVQPAQFSMQLDGETHRVRAADVVVANSGAVGFPDVRLGEGMRFDDGVVDVVVVRARSGFDYVRLAWDILLGRPKRDPRLRFYQVQRVVTIEADRPLPVQGDGEPLGQETVSVSVEPKAAYFLVPARAGHAAPAGDAISAPSP